MNCRGGPRGRPRATTRVAPAEFQDGTMATKTLLTVEAFLRRSEMRDVRYELVEGELITVSPTMPEHNDVRDTLLVALRNFLAGRGLGRVWAEQAFHLFGETVR